MTALPKDVAPGETVTIDAQMVIPDRPGNYTLVLDLISGGENWFQTMQSDILTRWLSVGAAPETADTEQVPVPETDTIEQEWVTVEPAPQPEPTPVLPDRAEARSSAAPHGPPVVDIASTLPPVRIRSRYVRSTRFGGW